jgi:hypothetical protein
MFTYTLLETDNGNCRVYYRAGRKLRCFQEDRPGEFVFYICSSDGEPECEAKPAPANEFDRLPEPECSTSRNFRSWWNARS